MGEVPVLEHDGRRLSQSGVILDYLVERPDASAPRTTTRRREILRWTLFDNHKLTSYTATYRLHARSGEDANPDVLAEFRKRAEARGASSTRT
jgi:glutathione S-transferase